MDRTLLLYPSLGVVSSHMELDAELARYLLPLYTNNTSLSKMDSRAKKRGTYQSQGYHGLCILLTKSTEEDARLREQIAAKNAKKAEEKRLPQRQRLASQR